MGHDLVEKFNNKKDALDQD